MNKLSHLALLSLAALPANAFFLMPCWPVSTQRIDPIVDPGTVSSHVHQIAGGNGFAPAMNYSNTQAADCTTCFVKGDKSNYWIPALYVKLANGSFEKVDQVGSASMYYFNEASRLGPGEKLEPFPKGLHMLAGDPDKRSPGTDAASQAINYKCLDYSGTPSDSKTFPTKNCPNGVRAEVTYPSCWDGKNLDSADHKSHMAYPTINFENGACPSTHPHHVVTMKVEFIFDTNKYKGEWSGGKQPFVWSSGDETGYGLHADYVMGWDYALLTSAIEQCFDEFGVLENCAPFAGQIQSAYVNPGTCKVDSYVDEDVGGVVEKMPGCNTLSTGPGESKDSPCNDGVKLMGKWANAQDSGLLQWVGWSSDSASASTSYSSLSTVSASSVYVAPTWGSVTKSSASSAAPSSTTTPAAAASPWESWSSAAPKSGGPHGFYSKAAVVVNPAAAPVAPHPSPAPSPSTSQPEGQTKKVLTVTDIVTEVTWVTESTGSPSTPAAAASTQVWSRWRREIGDDVHKHQLRHIQRRRGTRNHQ